MVYAFFEPIYELMIGIIFPWLINFILIHLYADSVGVIVNPKGEMNGNHGKLLLSLQVTTRS